MILNSMRIHLLRALGRTLWVLLLVCAGFLPLLHAAHHVDSTTYCTVCHFAHGGVPALLRPPVMPASGASPVPAPAPVPDIQHAGPTSLCETTRGPPASSPAWSRAAPGRGGRISQHTVLYAGEDSNSCEPIRESGVSQLVMPPFAVGRVAQGRAAARLRNRHRPLRGGDSSGAEPRPQSVRSD